MCDGEVTVEYRIGNNPIRFKGAFGIEAKSKTTHAIEDALSKAILSWHGHDGSVAPGVSIMKVNLKEFGMDECCCGECDDEEAATPTSGQDIV